MISTMKKAKVDPNKCIGCATCVGIADQSFKMNEDTNKAVAIHPAGDSEEQVEMAIESCPAEAISWVTEEDEAPAT